MTFDRHGHLFPYQPTNYTWESFLAHFVDGFGADTNRRALADEFEIYLREVKSFCEAPFWCWVDGSFATSKSNPNDLDCVLFLPSNVFDRFEEQIASLRRRREQPDNRIDGYFVPVYPEGHRKRFWYESDRIRWFHAFGTSLTNQPKGIISLSFNHE